MAGLEEKKTIKVTLEMAQDAEEFIRELVRDEIAKAMEKQVRSRGWQAMKPVGPTEQK